MYFSVEDSWESSNAIRLARWQAVLPLIHQGNGPRVDEESEATAMDGTVPTMETNRVCVRLGGSGVCVGGCRNGLLHRGGVYLVLVLCLGKGVSGWGMGVDG